MERQILDLSVTAEPARDSLQIELTNSSTETLDVYEHSLPWVGWHSMILIAVKTDVLGSLLDKDQRIDDPGPSSITIEPDETLSGKISLPARFPGFRAARAERDIIVFWSYRLQPIGAPPSERLGGAALFPKLKKDG